MIEDRHDWTERLQQGAVSEQAQRQLVDADMQEFEQRIAGLRDWQAEEIQGIQQREFRRAQLRENLNVVFNAITNRLTVWYERQSYSRIIGPEDNREEIEEIMKQQLIHDILHSEEQTMPETDQTPFTTPNIGPQPDRTLEELGITPVEAPIFTMQQDTQAIQLRALRERYPDEVHNQNLQLPTWRALHRERVEIRNIIANLRRMTIAREIWRNTPDRFKDTAYEMIGHSFSSVQMRNLELDEDNWDLKSTSTYRSYMQHLCNYDERKAQYMEHREKYQGAQAEYNQRVAMIRQHPRVPYQINTQEIVQSVSQWPNIWGISAVHDVYENKLKIRIGVCDMVMSESAEYSRYDYEANILLAPFYFTIVISEDGSFYCPSTHRNAAGLTPDGELSYSFHPHQLSDTPCFGSFGQTMVDLMKCGDVIALISTILAFYGQYNSADSAGVNAQLYWASLIPMRNDFGEYKQTLYDRVRLLSDYHVVDRDKLSHAVERYKGWHQENRSNPAPERTDYPVCTWCEEEDVSDNYWNTADGERVCEGCWENHFCSNCEHSHENCECREDDY